MVKGSSKIKIKIELFPPQSRPSVPTDFFRGK